MCEVLVACTLLSSALGFSTQLLVRHARLLSQQRQYRLGLDEICNQADRLTALSEPEIRRELETLAISEFAKSHLPGARISGELNSDKLGHRLSLQLVLPEARKMPPIRMSVWVMPAVEGAVP
jgi:hypothetical protein